MTKQQALALLNALEGQGVPSSAHLTFPQPGAELWTVSIDGDYPLTGAQLAQLANYCTQNGLALSAQFSYLGVG